MFPGTEMERWCDLARELVGALNPGQEGLREHHIWRIAGKLPGSPSEGYPLGKTGPRAIIPALFWGAWIDQVLYFVLVDRRMRSQPHGEDCYLEFRRRYPFPALRDNAGRAYLSPAVILQVRPVDPRTLKEVRREFWDQEVAEWLSAESDYFMVRMVAEKMFRLDMQERFPDPLSKALWPEWG